MFGHYSWDVATIWNNYRKTLWFFSFALLTVVTVFRYPVYWRIPNFYAEDGTVFFKSVNNNGLQSIFETFNGYPIIGLRFLTSLSYYFALYPKFGNLELVAVWMSIISYGFWAFLSIFTFSVLKHYVDFRLGILGAVLVLCAPLNGWQYAILGTLGNLKFSFSYIAFLLLLSRLKTQSWTNSNKFFYVVCILTNPIAIIFLPGFLISMKWNPMRVTKIDFFFAGTVLLVFARIYSSAQNFPLPASYKSGTWGLANLFEVILGRTVYFPFAADQYQNFSIVFMIFTSLFVYIIFLKYPNANKYSVAVGVTTAILITTIFIVTRGGFSTFYDQFKDPGPAMFFYPQNMVILTSTIIFLGGTPFYSHINSSARISFCILILLVFLSLNAKGIGFNNTGVNGDWQTNQGSVKDNQAISCLNLEMDEVSIPILPGTPWSVTVPRSQVC